MIYLYLQRMCELVNITNFFLVLESIEKQSIQHYNNMTKQW